VAIVIERDEQRRWLRARATGVLTLDELVAFIRTARNSEDLRMWPMIFNGDEASTTLNHEDVDGVVDIVLQALATTGAARAHVAVATRDDRLYRWMLLYEERCAEKGARFMRVFPAAPPTPSAGWRSSPTRGTSARAVAKAMEREPFRRAADARLKRSRYGVSENLQPER
jgi:hypothetical protein